MKNLSFLVILTALSFTLQAQEVKEYGPSSGSFAVGIAANPAFEYLGNFFGKTVNNNAPTANLANGYHLFGKYFSSPKTAVRAGISFGYDTETTLFGIEDENKLNETGLYAGLALGLEKRHGQSRVQAFYGPSVGVGFSSASDTYKYAEDPATGDILKQTYGSSLSFALGAFAGVEYFLLSNIALGTEIGMGLNFSSNGKGSIEREGLDIQETGNKSSSLDFGFSNTPAQMAPRGTIYLSVYF